MLTLKLIASVIGNVAVFGVLLFVPAGTLAWWRAWVLLGVVFVACSLTMVLVFSGNEESLNERFKVPIQPSQPPADKIVTILLILAFAGFAAFIPFDVFRFHLMGPPAAVVSALGLALFVAGWAVMSLALRENAFAAPIVKYQPERRQGVIDTGVYAIVRHPMYAGAIPLMIGMPLWLQSYASAVLALAPIAILAVRIPIEEKLLRRELPGYAAYAEKVRSRLIPFIW
jgi:protein-S-isoprenylcysteine O-methyltransferase Ste14